jgi:hypothetical protein
MQLIGIIIAIVPVFSDIRILYLIGAFLLGLGTGAIGLLIPMTLVNGRGGVEILAISFGSIYVFSKYGVYYSTVMGGILYNTRAPGNVIISCMILGLIFFIPVKALLFKESPPQRGYSFSLIYRNPISTAFTCLIPFFYLYWIYRVHGEAASIAPSRKYLSPRASLWTSIFAPFLIPVCMTSLADALNSEAAKQDRQPYKKILTIFLWSVFCIPVGLAMLQSILNKAMKEAPSPTPAASEATAIYIQ